VLYALVLFCAVMLTVLWSVVLVQDYIQLKEVVGATDVAFHTFYIVLGAVLFVSLAVLTTILSIRLFANMRWSQRQSDFLASVSHELNSPLSSIKLFAQTLRRGDLVSEDRERFAGRIVMDTDRLSRLIANILRAAEVDRVGADLAVSPGVFELHGYLAEFVEDARTVYADKVTLTLTGDDEAWAEVDPIMFRQVLDNLVDNAIRYRGKGPALVELRLRGGDDWTELQVIDKGMGIPSGRLENVFERFYQLEEGQPPTGRRGMGIGLNVVRSIVRSHGGQVEARSEGPGKGTTIRIRLPGVGRVEVEA